MLGWGGIWGLRQRYRDSLSPPTEDCECTLGRSETQLILVGGGRWSCVLGCVDAETCDVFAYGNAFLILLLFSLLLPLSFQQNFHPALLLSLGKDKEIIWPDQGQQSQQSAINDDPQSPHPGCSWANTSQVSAKPRVTSPSVAQPQLSHARRSLTGSFSSWEPLSERYFFFFFSYLQLLYFYFLFF